MYKVSAFRSSGAIWTGVGSVKMVGPEAVRLGARKVLVLTDPGVMKAGLIDKIRPWLEQESLEVDVYAEVQPEPPVENFEQCLNMARAKGYDLFIGVGGGSSMDMAKLLSVMCTNPGTVYDYFGVNKVLKPGLPKIAVPTTAGTGSEVTAIGILTVKEQELKIGVVSPYMIPDVAIVDPELTLSMPPKVTAATGMDALTHAIESYTSVNATPITDAFALEAVRLISTNLRDAVAYGENVQSRESVAMGSLLAGLAFANAGVTAVHALSFPLGGKYGVAHGVGNALMLPWVMEFNILGNIRKFAQVAEVMGEDVSGLSIREAAFKSVESIRVLCDDVGIPKRLKDIGLSPEHLQTLTEGAASVTRILVNNPRKIDQDDIRRIYENAM